MADKRVDVLTRFTAETGQLDRAMRRSTLHAQRLNDRITGIVGSLGRAGALALGVAGFGGVGYAIVKTSKDMIGLNRELETARIGIATVLQQRSVGGKGPFEGWDTALKASNATMLELERRAAKLPGTTAEFRRGFELLLPMTARAGRSVGDTIGLAEKVVVAAKVGNVYGGTETVARDVQQILSGTANLAQINTIALKGRAKEIAEIARKDLGGAVKEIEKALSVAPEALAAFSRTFETQASTFQDAMQRTIRTAGEPVFAFATEQLALWNGWLDKNRKQVEAIAKSVGQGIVKGIKTAAEWAKKLYDRWDDIKAVIRTVAEVWIATKLVASIGKVITAIKGAGGLGAAIRGLIGPIGVVIAAMETMRMMWADPLGDRAKELGLTVVRPGDIRAQYKGGGMSPEMEQFFRSRLPGSETVTWRTNPLKGGGDYTQTRLGIDRATDAALSKIAKDYEAMKAQQRAAGAFKFDPGSFATKVGQTMADEVANQKGLLNDPFLAERPPVIDARGSTFKFDQRFEEGDPERIFFEIRSALVKPFLPRLGSTLAPS